MSRQTTERLLAMLEAIEQGSQWPIQAVTGFVMALEKTAGATTVDQYRPITVFSLVFRTWGSIRARQVLRHLASVAPSSCVGNLPGKTNFRSLARHPNDDRRKLLHPNMCKWSSCRHNQGV